MTSEVKTKLAELPKSPGVYFHKNARGEIIYVGKAAVLRNRVRQYFQKSRSRDPKTEALVSEIVDIDWMVVESELEALFLEAEMIRRYMPQYNILLRDDKSMTYIRIDYDSQYPTVSTTRRPLDDGARYFGPYLSALSVRKALRILRKIFPYATREVIGQKRANLQYHLGLDPGLEEGKTSLQDYRANLRKLIAVIEGKRSSIIKELERDMSRAAKQHDFEIAAKLRNQVFALQNLGKQVIFSDKEFLDISKDHALSELVDLLSLEAFPRRIEGYDISHMQGSDVVASMVVFTNGVSDKGQYRKFKTHRDFNNDFANMHETITRRLSERNLKLWGKPSLVLIDGGKGQLDAATRARDEQDQAAIPFVGLAKREEQIVIHKHRSNVTLNEQALHALGGFLTESEDFILVNVPHNTNVVKLLQRIRDESHRFAVSYHSVLKVKRQTSSQLDDIPGVGPTTRKKLLRAFGSVAGLRLASVADIAAIVGESRAKTVHAYLSETK
jgi:excinuclease ABC subunit C